MKTSHIGNGWFHDFKQFLWFLPLPALLYFSHFLGSCHCPLRHGWILLHPLTSSLLCTLPSTQDPVGLLRASQKLSESRTKPGRESRWFCSGGGGVSSQDRFSCLAWQEDTALGPCNSVVSVADLSPLCCSYLSNQEGLALPRWLLKCPVAGVLPEQVLLQGSSLKYRFGLHDSEMLWRVWLEAGALY